MGTDGPDTFIESLTGSKTYQVAAGSDLPVLIIPEGVNYSDVNKVLFAFDYRRVSEVPMRQVTDLAHQLKAEIIMLQIIEERWTHQIETEILSAQDRLAKAWPGSAPLRFETVYADGHENLQEYVQLFNADMIAIGYHKQGVVERVFNKSKIFQIIAGASYPLLIVHS